MFEKVQKIIAKGVYNLADLSERIKTLYTIGDLTDDEMNQLLDLARSNADTDAQLPDLVTRMGNLEMRVAKLESQHDDTAVSSDDWPAYVQPTSKDTLYNKDDRITWTDGAHYVCLKNNVAHGPDLEPDKWSKVTE